MNRHTVGGAIILTTLLAEAPRFVRLNLIVEGMPQEGARFIGLLVGLGMSSIAASTAFGFHTLGLLSRYARDRRSHAFWVCTSLVAMLLILEGVMLVPYMVAGVRGQSLAQVLPGMSANLWGIAMAFAPLFGAATVAFCLIATETSYYHAANRASRPRRIAPSGFICGFSDNGHRCDERFRTPQALARHLTAVHGLERGSREYARLYENGKEVAGGLS